MNKGKSDLNHLLCVQKKIDLSKKTKFASSEKVNPNRVSKKVSKFGLVTGHVSRAATIQVP